MKQVVEIIAVTIASATILIFPILIYKLNKDRLKAHKRIDKRFDELQRINDFLFDCLRSQLMNLHYKEYYMQWSRYYKIFNHERKWYYDSDDPITLDTFFDREQLNELTQGLN